MDLGIQTKNKEGYDDEDYESKYLNELTAGDKITGTIYISDIKWNEFKGTEVPQIYVILKDDKNKIKWICGTTVSRYVDKETEEITIYGARGGRTYTIIDSFNHAVNGTPENELENYKVVLSTFRDRINNDIETVTVEAINPVTPNAKNPNIRITKAVGTNGKTTDDEVDGVAESKPKEGGQQDLTPFDVSVYKKYPQYAEIKHLAELVEQDHGLSGVTLPNVQEKAKDMYGEGRIQEGEWPMFRALLHIE